MITRHATRQALPTKLFHFRGCLHASKRAASTSVIHTIPASQDDKLLVALLDQPKSRSRLTFTSRTGIFGHPTLTHPQALVALANSTLVRAQLLTERILRARESRDELVKVVKNLDRLSDLLCGVIDLSEFIQSSHPERIWVEAANTAYETLCEYINVLNTHKGLYDVLKAVFDDKSIMDSLSPEALRTALIFWRDFEKSAISQPEHRDRYVQLSSEVLVLGRQFLQQASAPRHPALIKPSELVGLKDQGMGVRLRQQARFTNKDLHVYPGSLQAQMIMRSAPLEEPRRKLYMAQNSSPKEHVETLDLLLRKRAEMAQLVGRESYADLALVDTMAKSSHNVQQFLDALMDYTRPSARRALKALSTRKQKHLGTSPFPIIQAWDRDFYCPPEAPAPPIPLPPLTVGTVFMGLSRLFKHIYGVSLRPAESASGEVWTDDVLKLEVVDEEKGVVGWIYADIFARAGKSGGAAHYTVRCSRRTDNDDDEGDLSVPEAEQDIRISREFEAMKRHQLPGQDGVYQLPLVALLCQFPRPTILSGPTVLEWHDITVLFHEMGHAMHSMFGRTEYQNVSGTRCATDFVELPSILMEHFLTSPAVLTLFSPDSSTASLDQQGNTHEDPCHAIDTYGQILLSAIDQQYHSPRVLDPSFNSTEEFASLQNTKGIIPFVPGTSFQTQFGHLFSYGATYYSYMFDRAIAARVWRNVFSGNPLDRETGEKYKNEVLRYGGGKDPWKMVATLLNSPQLENGDAEAMREVGRWRVEDEVGNSGNH